jgi:magnesium-transporting ATPase (P-type)
MKPEAVQLSPDLSGLTSARAAVLLEQHGLNQMPAEREVPKWKRLLLELTHFFAVMLWVAAALAFVAGLPELGVAIIVVVVVNGLFAYVQQEKAQHAAAKLRQLLPSEVTARRDGRNLRVHSTELVPGDVVILSSGDRVPADLTLAVVSGCAIDESMLTGESEPVHKLPGEPAWGGTFLVNGQAEAVVSATGAATRLAGIAALAGNVVPPPSPLSLELRRIVRTVSILALAVGSMFFAVSLAIGIAWRDAFLFAIGVCVALIPEGLLPTVTLSLAMGAQTMARRNALVRNLQAVETLGSTTFICTDKTGTLTQNRMNVVEVWTSAGLLKVTGEGYEPHAAIEGPGKEQALRLGLAARAASQGRAVIQEGRWRADGDPMEAAIDVLTRRLTPEAPPEATPLARFAFDPKRRRESVIVGATLFVKGAPEAVLPLCAQVPYPSDDPPSQCPRNGVQDLQAEAYQMIEEMAGRGLRVLAVAQRPLQKTDRNWKGSLPEELEEELELLGLLGLHDPPRPGVAQALTAARAAGIKVAMITGDHPSTAASIARETR